MKERGIRMRFGVGGLTKPMCDLLDNNQVDVISGYAGFWMRCG